MLDSTSCEDDTDYMGITVLTVMMEFRDEEQDMHVQPNLDRWDINPKYPDCISPDG